MKYLPHIIQNWNAIMSVKNVIVRFALKIENHYNIFEAYQSVLIIPFGS